MIDQPTERKTFPMPTNVLFLCPHAAGKSILGATYLRAATARMGVEVTVSTAGTDPDDEVMPSVRAALEAQGFVVDALPRIVSDAQIEAADMIVSIGCEHDEIPTQKPITEWTVPMLSEDFPAAVKAIHSKAEDLAKLLVSRRPRG